MSKPNSKQHYLEHKNNSQLETEIKSFEKDVVVKRKGRKRGGGGTRKPSRCYTPQIRRALVFELRNRPALANSYVLHYPRDWHHVTTKEHSNNLKRFTRIIHSLKLDIEGCQIREYGKYSKQQNPHSHLVLNRFVTQTDLRSYWRRAIQVKGYRWLEVRSPCVTYKHCELDNKWIYYLAKFKTKNLPEDSGEPFLRSWSRIGEGPKFTQLKGTAKGLAKETRALAKAQKAQFKNWKSPRAPRFKEVGINDARGGTVRNIAPDFARSFLENRLESMPQ